MMARAVILTVGRAGEIVAGLDLSGDASDVLVEVVMSGLDRHVFRITATSPSAIPDRPLKDIYEEKPWLRLQDNYEAGKMRRKARK